MPRDGVSEVVDENMAAAARAHAVEWGQVTEGRTLVAYGGAAPLHAARLADKLKLDKVVVPTGAGVGSAIGFLIAPVSYEVVRSRYMLLSQFDIAGANAAMAEMRTEALTVVTAATPTADLRESRRAYMRYAGQGYEIAVSVPAGELGDDAGEILRAAFDQEYARLYGRTIPNLDVEVLSWTLTVGEPAAHPPEPATPHRERDGREIVAKRWVELYDAGRETMVQAGRYLREELEPGDRIRGPGVILEAQTTTVVPAEFVATVSELGYLVLDRENRGT